MSDNMVIIVTGANKGIGLEIVSTLARTATTSYLYQKLGRSSATIYLTARDEGRGKAALKNVQGDAAVHTTIEFAQLDMASKESVAKFKELIASKHKSVDVLVNNVRSSSKSYPNSERANCCMFRLVSPLIQEATEENTTAPRPTGLSPSITMASRT
jgi:NAD(P)-dependent dehydrogenase (short-subunit alcohol dehydrogenase family)